MIGNQPWNPTQTGASSQTDVPFAVEVRHLNFSFGQGVYRKQVLHDNNLAIRSGEFVVMTGPSGSGKTTLLSLIGALRSVQEGSVRVMGRELGSSKK